MNGRDIIGLSRALLLDFQNQQTDAGIKCAT
jgi:hypothetical protein